MAGLSGQVVINGVDIWDGYHAFLREEKRGGHDNLNAILARPAMKSHVGVNIREEDGDRYSDDLKPRREARDLTLHFAIVADTPGEFVSRYDSFVGMLAAGDKGWLTMEFPTLGKTLRVFMLEMIGFEAVSNLWSDSKQAGAFRVKFREPGSNA